MHRLPIALAFGLTGLAGCVQSVTSEVTTPIVKLPDGGEIDLEVVRQSNSQIPGKGPLAVWRTPDGERKVLITLVPAPGSPVEVLKIDSSRPVFGSDGMRVWLIRDNEVVASFDYNGGVAVLGPAGQPEWARLDK